MDTIRFDGKTITIRTVLDWWLEKLQKRSTVPEPIQRPYRVEDPHFDHPSWNQAAALDYLKLSYFS